MLKHLQGRPPRCLGPVAQDVREGMVRTEFVQPEEEMSEGRAYFCLHLTITVFEDWSRDLERL